MEYTLSDFLVSDIVSDIRLLTGQTDFSRVKIESVSVQELPAEDFIKKNELVLSTALGCTENAAAFKALIKAVSLGGGAALLLCFPDPGYTVPSDVISYADSLGLPLFSIPWEDRFSDIQTAVARKIQSRKMSTYMALQTELFNAYYESRPFSDAAALISRAFGCPAAILDISRNILASSQDFSPDCEAAREAEIKTGGRLLGYLVFSDSAAAIFSEDSGSMEGDIFPRYIYFPLSLWFNRINVEDMVKLQLRNDFVWDLANKNYQSVVEMLKQGKKLHFELNQPYCCVLLKALSGEPGSFVEDYSKSAATLSSEIENFLIHRGRAVPGGVMVASRNLDFIMFAGCPEGFGEEALESFLDELHSALSRKFPACSFRWGLSEISPEPADFHGIYLNADLALRYCLHRNGPQYRFTYRDTKTAQIISLLSGSEKIRRMAEEVLAPLKAHDSDSGLDLTATLSCFIDCSYNTSLAARRLHIHRQSMLYRLEKIQELTGMSLSRHQDLFLLEVCTRIFANY